jgi:hypothetical protein
MAKLGQEPDSTTGFIQVPTQIFQALTETLPRFGESSSLIVNLAGFHDQIGQRLIRVHDCLTALETALTGLASPKPGPRPGQGEGYKPRPRPGTDDGFKPRPRPGTGDGFKPRPRPDRENEEGRPARANHWAKGQPDQAERGQSERGQGEPKPKKWAKQGPATKDYAAARDKRPPADRAKGPVSPSPRGLAAKAKNRDQSLVGPTEDSLTQAEVDELMRHLFK